MHEHKLTVECTVHIADCTLTLISPQAERTSRPSATSNGNALLLTALVITSSHPRQRNIFVGGCMDGGEGDGRSNGRAK